MNLQYLRSGLAGITLAVASLASLASPITLQASGTGWCNSSGSCNNTNINGISNHFSGNEGTIYRDWFSFALPTLGGVISSASISIWNSGYNTSGGVGAVFSLFQASGLSFSGLTSTASLGSVLERSANTGSNHYETIVLNPTGLSALNAAQGGSFMLAGNNDQGYQLFGYSGGSPVAYLSLTTTAIPEPATLALAGLALLGLVGTRRRRH